MSNFQPDAAVAGMTDSLTLEQRVRIAQHIDMVVADRLYRAMHVRAALANAEYRFTDLVDRYFFVVAGGCVLVAAVYLGLAEMVVRGLDHRGHSSAAEGAGTLAWLGLFLLLPAYMVGVIVLLRRHAMGRHWWHDTPRLTAEQFPVFGHGVQASANPGPLLVWIAAVGVTILAGCLPKLFLICLAAASAGKLLFVVYSKLVRNRHKA
jgi:hypothetical protein